MTEAAREACILCGLDCGVRSVRRETDGASRPFCCPGCANVYAILLESGAIQAGVSPRDTQLFKRSLELGLIGAGAAAAGEPQQDWPGAPRASRNGIPPDAPTTESLYQLSGLWCTSCAWLIEHALVRERGVVSAEVSFTSDLLKVRFAPQYIEPARIPARIASLGYRASAYTGEDAAADEEGRDLLLRMGVAVFLWLNVMMLNLAIYVGYFQQTPDSIRDVLPWVLMGLATPAVAYCAWPILRLAWHGVRNGVVRVETLLALGILAAYCYSVAESLRGGDRIYFDTVCAIVALLLIGKVIERQARVRTARSVTLLYRLMPKKARMWAADREQFVSIEALKPGDEFIVKAGERIPADGMVSEGEAHVDESVLTGESAPVDKQPGRPVACGSVTTDGLLRVTATRVGADSTLAQIVRTVEQSLARRSHIERVADRVSRVFVPVVVVIALVTFAGWWLSGAVGLGDALMRGVTVLVIACPCALGIATPLAVTAAVGTASRLGILVSDSRVLETTRRVDVVLLDKTGTVTWGDFALVHADITDLAALAAVEAGSEHPLGRAVVERARAAGVDVTPAGAIEVYKGQGVRGTVGGLNLAIGSRGWLPDAAAHLEAEAAAWEARGCTVAFYQYGDRAGLLAFGDRVRDDAAGLLAGLKARGIRTMVVSGDSRATTAWVAAQIGADDYRAEILPEGKAALVESLQAEGRTVAMVGDGINDAQALARANVGIALGSGADIAMKAAAVVLMHNRLGRVAEVFTLAHRTLRVVRQNLFWAFAYNTAGIGLAVAGVLNPIAAAIGMVLSSASVIINSSRLARHAEGVASR